MSPDPYAVLGVAGDASDDELDRAFRDLVRRLHPDTRGPDGPDAEADRRLQELLTAYAHVRDPIRRAAYDRARAGPVVRPRAPAPDRAEPALRVGPVRWEPPSDPGQRRAR